MSEPSIPARARSVWRRRVMWTLLAVVVVCVLAVALLPRLISSSWARGRIESLLSASVARPVRLGALTLTWSGELSIDRFEIADAPEFSPAPLLALRRLRVQVDPLRLIRRRLDLDVALDGLDVQVIRNADGQTNLEAFLAGLPPREPRAAAGPLALPVEEARVRVRVAGVSARAEDRARGRSAVIRNASVSLDLPGLWEPATAELHADLTVDGRTLPPVRVRGRVEKLVRPDRTLNLDGAIVDADGAFPGGTLLLKVDLGKPVAQGRLTADLAALADVARPFAPSQMAATRVAGVLDLRLDGTPRPGGALAFSFRVSGSRLTAAGGLLGRRAVGPVAFDVENTGTLDRARGVLAVEKGDLRVQQRSRASWTVTATDLHGSAPQVTATARGVVLDLQELAPVAAAFLPRGVALGPEDRTRPSSLTLRLATVSGPLAGGTNPVMVEGLVLSLPRLTVKSAGIALSGRGLALAVDHLRGTLTGYFPERLSIRAGFRCERLEVLAPRALTAEGIDASVARLDLSDLARASGLFPVTLRGDAAHSVSIRRLDVPRIARVREYRQSGEAQFSIGQADLVSLSLSRVGVRAEAVSADGAGASVEIEPSSTRPGLGVEVAGLRLSGRFPAGPNPVEISRATLAFARIRAKTAIRSVAAERVDLAVGSLSTVLRHQFPERLDLQAVGGIGALDLGGPRPATARDLRMPAIELRLADLRKDASALFGVTARVRLAESLTAGEATVPGVGRIARLDESAMITGDLRPGGQARLAVESFRLEAGAARAALPGLAAVDTAARVEGRVERVDLRGLASPQIDVDGLRLSVSAGQALAADLEASARGLGQDSLSIRGEARLDLAELARLIPEETRRGGRLSGTATTRWAIDGKLPASAEAERDTPAATGLVKAAGLGSVRRAVMSAGLAQVGVSLGLAGGGRVAVSGLSTETPLEARVQNGRLLVNAALKAEKIEALPGLGSLREPLAAGIRVQGEQTGPGSVRFSQSLSVERLGLTQEIHANLTGLDRLLARGLGSPLPLWLTVLGGDARASITLADVGGLGLASDAIALRGRLSAGMDLRLARGEDVAVGAWLKTADAEARLGNRIEVKGAHADLAGEKRYRLVRVAEAGTSPPPPGWLSEEVLNGRAGARLPPPGARGAVRFDAGSSLRLALVRSRLASLDLEAQHVGAAVSLASGLPVVDRFQADLLGGSVAGSFAVSPPPRPGTGRGLSLRLLAAFTGLDAARLVPDAPSDGEDAELSGRLALELPVETRLESILAGMRLETELSHIGARTLDRALYALDPSESNETIVKQRKLLRLGSPRRVTLGLKNGNLSVSGLVQAAGVRLDLPRVERVNVAAVAGLRRFDARLAGLQPILDLLQIAGADVLEIDDAGRVGFRKGDGR